jgi:hypothetical protein
MDRAHWQELIEAYLAGRLSAPAFSRRLIESAAAQVPPQALLPLLDEVQSGSEDETRLRAAAQAALADLGPAFASVETEQGFGGAQQGAPDAFAPEAMVLDPEMQHKIRRSVGVMGAFAGLGCLFMLGWVAIVVLQVFAIADQVQAQLDWSAVPSALSGILLAAIPIVGGVIAFFGARDEWQWHPILAGIVFLLLPTVSLVAMLRRITKPRRLP